MNTETYKTKSEDETFDLGVSFAKKLIRGTTVAFKGELGAGKTQFIKGVCSALEINEPVTSPTFTIVNEYFGRLNNSPVTIYHVDLYRLKKEQEVVDSGINEYFFSSDGITLLEWAEKAENLLPETYIRIDIELSPDDTDERTIVISYIS